jgi:hypothetical protein
MKRWIVLSVLLINSCAGLFPHRSYIEIMEDEQVDFFQPHDDFKVIPGDTGKAYRTNREIMRRTPATEAFAKERNFHKSLEHELRYHESLQNRTALKQYYMYRDQLGGVSEKLYFLKIPSITAREEYLRAKGLIQDADFYADYEFQEAEYRRELLVGMSKEQVIQMMGQPG